MARWPSLAVALALLAAPAALPAQREREPVDLPTLVAASRMCREGPLDHQAALRQARSQRWRESDGGLPANLRAMLPFPMLERDHVLLILMPSAMGGPSICEVVSSLRAPPAWPEIVAAVTAEFGRDPAASTATDATWTFGDRHAVARLDRGALHLRFASGPPAAPAATAPKPAAPPPAPLPGLDPAFAIERMMTCRDTPMVLNEALRHLVARGWPDVTRAPMSGQRTSYQFERDRIWLVVAPFNAALSECAVHATLPPGTLWPDVLRPLTAAIGRPPDATTETGARWENVDGRRIEAGLVDHRWFNMFFRPANAEPTPDPRALTAASTAPAASADEIATAAAACMAAAGRRVDAGAIHGAGWTEASERGATRTFSRPGSNIRIFAGSGGQCVVDAYGERRDSFDAIRDAIRARLTERFGAQAAMGQALGTASSPSRGQGYTVGERIGVLSSEQRDDGLSIRFTVMSTR